MNNRIFKTLLCFTLAVAVFLSGTVFALSPNSVYGYSQYGVDNSLFANNQEFFVISTDTIKYPNTTAGDGYYATETITDLASYIIYGGDYIQSTSSSSSSTYISISGGEVGAIFGGQYVEFTNDSTIANIYKAEIIATGGTIGTIYGGSHAGLVGSDDLSDSSLEETVDDDLSDSSLEATVDIVSISIGDATVGTIYGSGYNNGNDIETDTGSIEIYLSGGTVGNIYGISNSLDSSESKLWIYLYGGEIAGEVLAVEPSEVDFNLSEYAIEIALSSDLILSGANSVIGSPEYPVTDIYVETTDGDAPIYVNITNPSRSAGDVVAYIDGNVSRSEEEILSAFASEYYEFELTSVMGTFYQDDLEEYQAVDYYAVEIVSLINENTTSDDDDDDDDRAPLSKEYTVAGMLEEESNEETEETEEDDFLLEEYDNITQDGDSYYVDGKYDGGYYSNGFDAADASQSNQMKEDGEADIESFYNETFGDTGIEDDGYGIEKYEEMVTGLDQTEDGNYLLDGDEYSSLEDVLLAVKEKVNEDVYEKNLVKLVEKIAGAAHYCDDADTQELYTSGASTISQLSYASADNLSVLYAEVMDTISVAQSILNASSTASDAYDILIESGVLTSESETALESFYNEILAMLDGAITNSQVDEILAYFEEYILSLDVAKISLTDESGNILAVISQSGGMESGSQILLSEMSDISAYQQLLTYITETGDVSADNILTAILGVSNTLADMQVLGVYDISIDGNVTSENGKYTVKVKAPDNMEDIGTVKILHITDSGIELISATLSGGYLSFQTTSFSEFVILGSMATSLWYALIPITIIAMLVCAYVYLCKKEKKGDGDNG
ncbi:MAG: hypothetical protein R3Y18_01145 [Bacillota bacterium]